MFYEHTFLFQDRMSSLREQYKEYFEIHMRREECHDCMAIHSLTSWMLLPIGSVLELVTREYLFVFQSQIKKTEMSAGEMLKGCDQSESKFSSKTCSFKYTSDSWVHLNFISFPVQGFISTSSFKASFIFLFESFNTFSSIQHSFSNCFL